MKTTLLLLTLLFLSTGVSAQFNNLVWGEALIGDYGGNATSWEKTDKDNNTYYGQRYFGVVEFGQTPGSFTYDCGSGAYVIVKRYPNGQTAWILPFKGITHTTFDFDGEGNMILFAQLIGLTNVDYNASSSVLISNSQFLAKYGTNGQLIWHKSVPMTLSLFGKKVVLSMGPNDNIHIAGLFFGTQDFDFSAATANLTSPLTVSTFVAKYDASGNYLWSKKIVSTDNEFVNGIDVNNNGDVFMVGSYEDTLIVDPDGANIQLIESLETVSGESYVVKFSSSGSVQFAKTFAFSDHANIIGVHANNVNLHLFHNFAGATNLNPNAGAPIYTSTSGGILRLSAGSGTYFNNYTMAQNNVYLKSGTVTTTNTFLVTGTFSGSIDLNPGAGVNTANSGPGVDLAISEFTSAYAYIDSRVLESNVAVAESFANRTPNGSLALTGVYNQDVDLDYSAGTNIITTTEAYEVFWSYYSLNLPELNVTNSPGFSVHNGSTNPSIVNSTNFGDLCFNQNDTSVFIVQNTGLATLNVSSVSLSGPEAADFQISNGPLSIPSGGQATIQIIALANTVGIKNASVTLLNNDPDESTYTFAIQSHIRALPNVGISVNPNETTFCYGDSVTFNGTGADTYLWTNTIPDNSTFPIAFGGLYEVIGTTIYGCKDTASIAITVNPLPIVTVTSNDPNDAICLNDAIQLQGAGASSYVYTGGVTDQTDFFPTTTDSYTVTGTDANGCENTASITITVNPLPTVSVTSNDPNDAICLNDTIQLQGAGASSYVYTGGVTDQTDFFPTTTDSYTVTGTDANGCENTASITITVNPLPTVSVTSNDPNDAICLNDAIQLQGAGASSYVYTGGVTDQTDFFPTTTDSYTVTGTDANGCENTASITITVNPLPIVTVTSNDPNDAICLNDAIQLQGAGASSYVYTGGVTDQTDFFPTTTDSYTVTGTDANGCENTASITITVNPLPNVTVTSNDPNDAICLNDAIQLQGAGASSYVYTGGVTDQTDFFPTTTDSYTVTGTDANGCENTASITITVNPLPNVTVTSTDPDDTICENATVQLIGAGGISYTYTNGVFDQTDFSLSATDTFVVTGTDANGCQNLDTIQIFVENTPTLDGGPDLFVCFGNSVQLNATGNGTITWSGGLSNNAFYTPSNPSTELICSTITGQGCTNSDTIIIDLGAEIITVLTTNIDSVFANAGYSNYEWFDCNNNNQLASGTNNWTQVTYDGDFYAVITDSFGCEDTTDCITVNYTTILENAPVEITFMPNPTSGMLYIQTTLIISSIDVYDNAGRLVVHQNGDLKSIDLAAFSRGNYLVKVSAVNGAAFVERITKN